MNTENKQQPSSVNTFIGSNNENIHLYSYDVELNQKYLMIINENKELRILLNKALEKLKTKDLLINFLLDG